MSDTMRVLTEEAIKMRKFPDITFTHGPTGRRATFIQAIFAQRPEKVKVRISGSAGPFRPLRHGPRHGPVLRSATSGAKYAPL